MSTKPFYSYYTWANFTRVKPIAWVLRESERAAAEEEAAAEKMLQLAAGEPGSPIADGDGGSVGTGPRRLQKRLGAADLIFYGVGSTVGAGIYSLVGPGMQKAGVMAFLLAPCCRFTASPPPLRPRAASFLPYWCDLLHLHRHGLLGVCGPHSRRRIGIHRAFVSPCASFPAACVVYVAYCFVSICGGGRA